MGHNTTIFGFIECASEHAGMNQKTIDAFAFDDVYPFVNSFGWFNFTYQGATVPFSQNFKGDSPEEWRAWFVRFEELLSGLRILSATVIFDSEMKSKRYVRDYVCVDEKIVCYEVWFGNTGT